jgi:hypothetical protein
MNVLYELFGGGSFIICVITCLLQFIGACRGCCITWKLLLNSFQLLLVQSCGGLDGKLVISGLSGSSFKTRFKEHTREYHLKSQKSLFAKHLFQNQHTLLPTEDCLTILHHQKKGRMLNTIEQFHIYKVAKTVNHLNDHYTDTHNAIFETVLRHT